MRGISGRCLFGSHPASRTGPTAQLVDGHQRDSGTLPRKRPREPLSLTYPRDLWVFGVGQVENWLRRFDADQEREDVQLVIAMEGADLWLRVLRASPD